MTEDSFEGRTALLLAGIGLANVLLALFLLPRSTGLDEPLLYSAVYARQHFGRLFYPYYDQPLMYLHPPTKYWLVAVLASWGVPLRWATAGLFVSSYLVAIGAVLKCRLTFFQRLAALSAIPAAVTLYPFSSYSPENVTYAEVIGRLRPDDLVLMFWLSGLLWLEASRRAAWRASYSFIGGLCIGVASVMHWFGLAALGVVGVYGGAVLLDEGRQRTRRLAVIGLGTTIAVFPCALALWPYLRAVSWLVFNQAGDGTPHSLADAWQRHVADFWYLQHWVELHVGNVWPTAAMLAGPAWMGIPPIVFGGSVLLAFRSSRVLGLAGVVLPLAVLCASHKSPGYELPEITLFLLACGWALAAWLDRMAGRGRRLAALGLFLVPLATSSPLLWHPSELRLVDDRHSPELLRAMGRAIIGSGASVVGSFYTAGEDRFILNAGPLDAGIDFAAEREFHLASGSLHRLYLTGQTRLAGFVFTPDAPSASIVYFTDRKNPVPLRGFVMRNGQIERFSSPGTGWQLRVLRCRATPDELSWVSPRAAVAIAGYVPRTDHCVNNDLRASGLEGRFASLFLRRTWSFSSMAEQVIVPLLIDDAADAKSATGLESRCGCETVERFPGALSEVPAHWLLAALRQSDRTIEFYANSADLIAGRSLESRFSSRGLE